MNKNKFVFEGQEYSLQCQQTLPWAKDMLELNIKHERWGWVNYWLLIILYMEDEQ